jgi:hypothetical protein
MSGCSLVYLAQQDTNLKYFMEKNICRPEYTPTKIVVTI